MTTRISISDILVVMDQGVVKQIGSPIDIYQRPVDAFVAHFIGHINFFSGEIYQEGTKIQLVLRHLIHMLKA